VVWIQEIPVALAAPVAAAHRADRIRAVPEGRATADPAGAGAEALAEVSERFPHGGMKRAPIEFSRMDRREEAPPSGGMVPVERIENSSHEL
jgi:hypothetical protein